MKMQRVFLTWTILQMEMNSDFKKHSVGVREGGFYPSHPPLRRRPHSNHVPLKIEVVYT